MRTSRPACTAKAVSTPLEAAAQLFQVFQPLDVAFQVLAAGARAGGADGVGGHHDEGQRGLGLHVAVVGLNGMDDGRVLFVLAGDLHADLDVAALDLVVQGLADVVQKARAPGLGHIHAHLGGQQAGEVGHFQGVVSTFWPKLVRNFSRPSSFTMSGWMPCRPTSITARSPSRFMLRFQLAAALLHRLLDAGGVDAAVGDKALQRHAGHLAAGLVEAGQGDGLGGVVDDEVHAGGGFQGADVAALPADDAALHVRRWAGAQRSRWPRWNGRRRSGRWPGR